jgi:hypothetical protein
LHLPPRCCCPFGIRLQWMCKRQTTENRRAQYLGLLQLCLPLAGRVHRGLVDPALLKTRKPHPLPYQTSLVSRSPGEVRAKTESSSDMPRCICPASRNQVSTVHSQPQFTTGEKFGLVVEDENRKAHETPFVGMVRCSQRTIMRICDREHAKERSWGFSGWTGTNSDRIRSDAGSYQDCQFICIPLPASSPIGRISRPGRADGRRGTLDSLRNS